MIYIYSKDRTLVGRTRNLQRFLKRKDSIRVYEVQPHPDGANLKISWSNGNYCTMKFPSFEECESFAAKNFQNAVQINKILW